MFGLELPEATAHGMCLANFDPTLVWLTVAGDLMIFLAYCFGMPWATWRLLPFIGQKVVVPFLVVAAFIYLCGGSHLFDLIVIRRGSYELYFWLAWERILTGVVSWAAVWMLHKVLRENTVRLVNDRTLVVESK